MNNFPPYKVIPTSCLKAYKRNSRTHSDLQIDQIVASITEFGFTNPILADADNTVIAGHGRLLAADKLGITNVPVIVLDGLTDAQKQAYVIADNKLALNAGWDDELLKLELSALDEVNFDLSLLGFSDGELGDIFGKYDNYMTGENAGSMSRDFGVPPFSVLNARSGWWRERKKQWMQSIGDEGESRQGALAAESSLVGQINSGVSILDPVMAEIVCRWFGVPAGVALDPFAGDSVFGYVAGSTGMKFKGIELREEQALLNSERTAGLDCEYFCDTSENMDAYIENDSMDLVFSCPPYADLEVYSDNPDDLSTMPHAEFFAALDSILANTFNKLKDNRFAVVVVGEVRDKSGNYISLVPRTVATMIAAGYSYYNEIILVTPVGTLPMRAGKSMSASRKIGKTHQNILVFLKGSATEAAGVMGDIEGFMDTDGSFLEDGAISED